MDKFGLLLFNNRKALDKPITERTYQSYKGFNDVIEMQTLVRTNEEFGYTWDINDGYIVGAGE